MLPVPLNSSKIKSSARLPVSISAVARMVRLPPSSTLRAAPEKLFRFHERLRLHAAGHGAAFLRLHVVIPAREARDAVEEDDNVLLDLEQALGALGDELGHLDVARGIFIEAGAEDIGIHGALQIGDLLGPLIDEQEDDVDFRVIGADRPARFP